MNLLINKIAKNGLGELFLDKMTSFQSINLHPHSSFLFDILLTRSVVELWLWKASIHIYLTCSIRASQDSETMKYITIGGKHVSLYTSLLILSNGLFRCYLTEEFSNLRIISQTITPSVSSVSCLLFLGLMMKVISSNWFDLIALAYYIVVYLSARDLIF